MSLNERKVPIMNLNNLNLNEKIEDLLAALKKKEDETMTTTEQIIAVATGLGWQASTTKYENRVVFDFQQYTPKGQDFNVSVEMKDGDFDRFLCELENFYEGFDPDYETYLWIGNDGHGKNGAPYHIKDIVTDMEEAEKMIETLYETLKKAIA